MGYVSSCCSAIFVSSAAQRYHLIICKGAKVKFRVNKHFSFFSILCLYKAFQEMGRRPCSEVAFSQWAFLSGEWARLRGSPPHQVDFPPLCMCGMFYTLPGFKKKIFLGNALFSGMGQILETLCEADTEIFYSKEFLCTETFHAERTWIPWIEALVQIVPSSF